MHIKDRKKEVKENASTIIISITSRKPHKRSLLKANLNLVKDAANYVKILFNLNTWTQ